jgi:hypothetical protein
MVAARLTVALATRAWKRRVCLDRLSDIVYHSLPAAVRMLPAYRLMACRQEHEPAATYDS